MPATQDKSACCTKMKRAGTAGLEKQTDFDYLMYFSL
jgi:hypothetical protein